MVGIDHYDSDDDRSYDKHHGEQHVFANQGNGTGSWRNQLHNDEKKHRQRKQDGDAQGHLLP